MGKFSLDEEENKHEHKEIFEAYVMILDEIINSQLYSKFTQEQIDAFYDHFTNNIEAYEQEDQETMDIMFGFCDFPTFKKQMIETKMCFDSNDTGEGSTSADEVAKNFKGEELYWELRNEDVNDKKNGWVRKIVTTLKDGSHAEIHQRKIEGGFSDTMGRCEIVLKDL